MNLLIEFNFDMNTKKLFLYCSLAFITMNTWGAEYYMQQQSIIIEDLLTDDPLMTFTPRDKARASKHSYGQQYWMEQVILHIEGKPQCPLAALVAYVKYGYQALENPDQEELINTYRNHFFKDAQLLNGFRCTSCKIDFGMFNIIRFMYDENR